jgi:ABC-type uncharacterized transport system substrate-binding protein
MRRIGLAVVLTLNLTLATLAVEGQQAGTHRIGVLLPSTAAATSHILDAFRQGLRELGYIDGKNIVLEVRWAEGRYDRLPDLASELVRLKVDVIVAGSTPGALAAKNATGTIPIVIVTTGDPVASGLVASLARPGRNLTGVTTLSKELGAKQLEVLKGAVPRVTRVALLFNPANPDTGPSVNGVEAAARVLGVEHQVLQVRDPNEFENAFAAMSKERAGALIVLADPMFLTHGTRIVGLAAKSRLPAMYGNREFVEVGGLLFYGATLSDMFRRAVAHVDKILKGAKPGDLPIEQPTKFELVINLKTAKALGLTLPPSLLRRADQVIE